MDTFSMLLRNSVVGIEEKVPLVSGEHRTAINFDNAATTPPFHSVMREICNFAPWYSSVHRGAGYKSVLSSNLYEKARDMVREFVQADVQRDVVIFTKGTTEAINLLAYKISQQDKSQVVLITEMEHLANVLPWRFACQSDVVSVDASGRLSLEDLETKLVKYKGKVRLVAVTGASNVTGYINPVYRIARLAHQYGAEVLVDGAQWVPHCPIDMRPHQSSEHIDYLVFSAHKMYAPFGAGVLIGHKKLFQQGPPFCKGGGTVNLVTHELVDWDDSPQRDEAGSPNVMGVAALVAAIETLQCFNMNRLYEHEKQLTDYVIKGLKSIPGIKLYGEAGLAEKRVSLVSFTAEGIHHSNVAKILSYEGAVAVRSGLFCAHPYVQKLLCLSKEELQYCHEHPDDPLPGLVRISFGIYNNCREIDAFLEVVAWMMRHTKKLDEKYRCIEREADYPRWLLKPVRKRTP